MVSRKDGLALVAVVLLVACEAQLGSMRAEADSGTGGVQPETEPAIPSTQPCEPGFVECGDSCIRVWDDDENCGSCGRVCPDDHYCQARECHCSGQICDGTCVDRYADDHCEACFNACPPGTSCGLHGCSCPGGASLCGDTCVDRSQDEEHCGDCFQACEAGQPCLDGECVTATLHHVLITGEGLSIGSSAAVVSEATAYEHVMFSTGVRAGADGLDELMPLEETDDAPYGETIATGAADTLAELAGPLAPRVLASAYGVDGARYLDLKKGTVPHETALAQVSAGAALADDGGDVHAVRAVLVVHGESDHVAGNRAYHLNLVTWQLDIQGTIWMQSDQTLPVPMFISQLSSFTAFGQSTSTIPMQQLAASQTLRDGIFVVGPKYFLEYVDGIHLTGSSTRTLGEYYGKALHSVLVRGVPWIPLSPQRIVAEADAIRIDFHVPSPPLVLDDVLVADPGNYGFVYDDEGATPRTITSVALDGESTVRIELDGQVGPNARVEYAMVGEPGQPAGPTTGARGNLRDSDPAVGHTGEPLYNWAVHFEAPVE